MLVDTSGCTYVFVFYGGNPPLVVVWGGGGHKGGGGTPVTPTTGGKYVWHVRVGHLSPHSQLLLLPPGVPPMPVLPCFTVSPSQGSELWRVLATTDEVAGGGGGWQRGFTVMTA